MNIRACGLGLLLLTTAGCDQEPARSEARGASAPSENYQAKIDALSPAQRDAVMLRAIRDAKQDCQAVVGTAAAGEQFGMPGWVARCSNGSDWMVMIRPDGTALVARREEKQGS